MTGEVDCYTTPVRDSASIVLFTQGGGKYLVSNQVKNLLTAILSTLSATRQFIIVSMKAGTLSAI